MEKRSWRNWADYDYESMISVGDDPAKGVFMFGSDEAEGRKNPVEIDESSEFTEPPCHRHHRDLAGAPGGIGGLSICGAGLSGQ